MTNQKKDREQARIFRLVGGLYHDKKIRMYAPWDVVRFEDGSTYELCPPLASGGEWVYIKNTTGEEEASATD